MPTGQQMIERAQQGDRAAFAQLLEQHYAMIYRVAYRFTGSRADAEDIAQDVCVALPGKLASFRGGSSLSTWLYRIVVNACRDFHKAGTLHRELDRRYQDLEHALNAESKEAARKTAWLYRSLARLDESLRETALLVLAEECSHAEAAAILGCAESTISWRMHELRAKLKQMTDSYP